MLRTQCGLGPRSGFVSLPARARAVLQSGNETEVRHCESVRRWKVEAEVDIGWRSQYAVASG